MTLLMIILAACAPAAPASVPTSVELPLVNTQIPTQTPTQAPEVVATGNPVVATDLPAPVMVATSRGPDLEATDPSNVTLASGQLQLVEFFRFT